MNNSHGIIVFGANGSGKTTLGRELARILKFRHIDIENYCFEESEIPYAKPRSREDYLKLMLDDIEKYRSFVITTVVGDLGEIIPKYYELAVYLSAPFELLFKDRKLRHLVCRVRNFHYRYPEFIMAAKKENCPACNNEPMPLHL